MERHTLHDAATNAAGQNASSHSYSAWRTAQQTQPRIFQYNPPNPQQTSQQQQQQPQQQATLSSQTGAGAGAAANLPPNIDKNIIFANSDRLAQQYNLQNAAPQTQPSFTALHDDQSAQAGADPNLSQGENDNNAADPSKGGNTPQTSSGGRVLASTKRAAQNRAAQRAFRQRKDRYIKSLEQKANEFDLSHSIIADLRKENIYLRDYVVRLQNEVDSLNTELGRAPMFTTATQQRPQSNQNQSGPMPVSLSQSYPLQIDPQTAAAAAAAAANVHTQENQTGLTRLAPADPTHNAISMPTGNDHTMGEQKPEETPAPKKGPRGRKRKTDAQAEAQ